MYNPDRGIWKSLLRIGRTFVTE